MCDRSVLFQCEILNSPTQFTRFSFPRYRISSAYGVQQVLVTYRKIQTLHVLPPISVPTFISAIADGRHYASCLSSSNAEVMSGRPRINPNGFHCVTAKLWSKNPRAEEHVGVPFFCTWMEAEKLMFTSGALIETGHAHLPVRLHKTSTV